MFESLRRMAKFAHDAIEFTILFPFYLLEFLTIFVMAGYLGGLVGVVLYWIFDYLGWPHVIAIAWGAAIALYCLATKLYERYLSNGGDQ